MHIEPLIAIRNSIPRFRLLVNKLNILLKRKVWIFSYRFLEISLDAGLFSVILKTLAVRKE